MKGVANVVTITNGTITTDVSVGAYNCIFARQGYYPVKVDDAECSGINKAMDANEEFVSGLNEKPLSQWTKDEVIKYAEINGIDIAGTKGPNEAKQIIRNYMQNR